MIERYSLRSATVAITLLLFAMFSIGADDSGMRFERVGHNLMCTCGCNQVLLECNHVGCPNSDGMRKKLATLVAQNSNDKMIYASFIEEYGNIVVASPSKAGFDRLAWIMPFVVLFGGLIGAAYLVRRWQQKHALVTSRGDVITAEADRFREKIRRETEL